MVKKKKVTDKHNISNDSTLPQDEEAGTSAEKMAGNLEDSEQQLTAEEDIKDELTLAREVIKELNDKYLRLYSEFDNYRKRTIRERAELLQTASSGLITQLLPVLDDFIRAERSFEKATDIEALKEGVILISNKFRKILEQKGLEEIKAIGEEFNTDIHEAVTNLPAESDDMRGRVVDEIEKGYTLNGAVIRFARVAVAN